MELIMQNLKTTLQTNQCEYTLYRQSLEQPNQITLYQFTIATSKAQQGLNVITLTELYLLTNNFKMIQKETATPFIYANYTDLMLNIIK